MKLIEAAPAPPRGRVRDHSGTRLAAWAVRLAWRWRLELLTGWTVLAVWGYLMMMAPHGVALLLTLLMVLGVLGLSPVRGRLLRVAYRAGRGDGGSACRHARLVTFNERLARITTHELVPAGDVLRVRLPAGQCATDLHARAQLLAAQLRCRNVVVERDPDNAKYAQVAVIRRDPLAGTVALGWPHLHADRLSIWEPIPVGVDDYGRPVTVSLVERHVLIGGEPGAGKSVANSMLIATAALDPDCELILLDGKQVELAVWRDSARAFVGPDVTQAVQVLRGLQTEINNRYTRLLKESRRKITRGDGLSPIVVSCDEQAFYFTCDDRKLRGEFTAVARDLVARGRAVGIIYLAATQKPSADVIPTSFRDLFGYRWALRCSTRDASDTILGAGWATLGYSAATIAGDQRGVGYLLAEGHTPGRLRSSYLSDNDLAQLAARARRVRGLHPRCAECGASVTHLDSRQGKAS